MRRPFVLGLFAVVVACRTPIAEGPKGAASSSAPPPSIVPPPRMGVTRAQAIAVFDAWLAAQNGGDFAAYEKLYAPRFEGVRRSGTHTVRLDRTRWMTERARMFKAPTTVTASERVVTTTLDGAEIRFVQAWSQKGYSDEGEKHMVLARENGKLLVAREEMLDSTLGTPGRFSPERFAFVVATPEPKRALHRGSTPDPALGLAIVEDANAASWAEAAMTGKITTLSLGHPVVTRRAVDPKRLPPHLASWVGKKVETFGASERACEGVVTGLSIVGRIEPHFGTRARWAAAGEWQGEPKPSDEAIAHEAWAMTEHAGRMLVADIEVDDAATCKGALWGRRAAEPKPALLAATKGDDKLRAELLAAARKTKAWADVQKRYEDEKDAGAPRSWDEFDAHVDVRSFGTILTLSIRAGSGCGSFGATLVTVWRRENGALTMVGDLGDVASDPLSAVDVDGDGTVELVFESGLARSIAGRYGLLELHVPSNDCGC